MDLRNKEDGAVYQVITEEDSGSFCIYAVSRQSDIKFIMHYDSIRKFLDDWEDVDQ